ncbi:MAG: lyase family protein [Alsobacter sp.]
MSFSPLDSLILGPLFRTEAMAEVFSDAALVRTMLRVETALARAQAGQGLAPAALAGALERLAPDAFDLAALGRATAVSGVPAIPFVKAVQRLLPPELEPFFHQGATTQDIVDGALVLQMREAFALLRVDLVGILRGLGTLAARTRDVACAGRTYGQHAAPVTFGYKVAVWLAGIAEEAARLPQVRDAALVASLGGPVGTLASLGEAGPAVLDAFASDLGLRAPSIAWHTRRSAVAGTGLWLASLLAALGKMATDIAHLASTEVGEVAEPHMAGRGGSSAMPHKRNPVGATLILAAGEAATGPAVTLLSSMQGAAHERPAGAWHAEWQALPLLFGLASGALAEARRLAEGLEANETRMRANLDLTRGLLFADAAAGALAGTLGRAGAHALVEKAAGAVRDGAADLLAALLQQPDLPAGLDRQKLAQAFDLQPAVAAGARFTERAVAAAAVVTDRLQTLSD